LLKLLPRAVLTSIISAALAGGGIAAVLAIALAAGISNVLHKPPPAGTKPAIAGAETEQARAYQALADRERMAQAIVENALDAVRPDRWILRHSRLEPARRSVDGMDACRGAWQERGGTGVSGSCNAPCTGSGSTAS
jgi:hypothetical protein